MFVFFHIFSVVLKGTVPPKTAAAYCGAIVLNNRHNKPGFTVLYKSPEYMSVVTVNMLLTKRRHLIFCLKTAERSRVLNDTI